jgi:HAMP domain-containing protein
MAFAALLLLVFSLALIAIGVVAAVRLRRPGRAAAPASQPVARGRSGKPRQSAIPAPASAAPAPAADYAGAPDFGAPGPEAARSTTMYPGGMDAEAAEIERLRSEIAELKAHGGGQGSLKRTQAVVAVAANVSGVLGLFVSLAALFK